MTCRTRGSVRVRRLPRPRASCRCGASPGRRARGGWPGRRSGSARSRAARRPGSRRRSRPPRWWRPRGAGATAPSHLPASFTAAAAPHAQPMPPATAISAVPEHQVAVVAGEARLGLDRDPDPPQPADRADDEQQQPPPGGRRAAERSPATTTRACATARTRPRPSPARRRLDPEHHPRPGVLAELGAERALGERRRVRAHVLRAGDAAEQVPGSPQLGPEPQHRDQHEQRADQPASARVLPPQLQAVRPPHGHSSGRSSAARNPTANAWRGAPSRCARARSA